MDEMSPTEELQIRTEAIASTINSLYEMSFLIRNQSTRRLAYARAQSYQPRDPDEEKLLQSYVPLDQRHVEDLFKDLRRDEAHPGAIRIDQRPNGILLNETMKKRCVAAIGARRRQLAYWKNHDRKLQSAGQQEDSEATGTLFSGTQASAVYKQSSDELVESQSVNSSLASTVRDIDGNEAVFPGPPRRQSNAEAFVCPFCFVLCGPRDAEQRRWRYANDNDPLEFPPERAVTLTSAENTFVKICNHTFAPSLIVLTDRNYMATIMNGQTTN